MKIEIMCQGRDEEQNYALEEAIPITVINAHHPGCNDLSILVDDCPYSGGGHSQKCLASPGKNYGICPYNIDLPHAIDTLYKE